MTEESIKSKFEKPMKINNIVLQNSYKRITFLSTNTPMIVGLESSKYCMIPNIINNRGAHL